MLTLLWSQKILMLLVFWGLFGPKPSQTSLHVQQIAKVSNRYIYVQRPIYFRLRTQNSKWSGLYISQLQPIWVDIRNISVVGHSSTDNKIRNDLNPPGSEKTPENRSKVKHVRCSPQPEFNLTMHGGWPWWIVFKSCKFDHNPKFTI